MPQGIGSLGDQAPQTQPAQPGNGAITGDAVRSFVRGKFGRLPPEEQKVFANAITPDVAAILVKIYGPEEMLGQPADPSSKPAVEAMNFYRRIAGQDGGRRGLLSQQPVV